MPWITIKHWLWLIRPGTTCYLVLGKPEWMASRGGELKHSKSSLCCIRRLARLGGSLQKLGGIMRILWRPTTNHIIDLWTPARKSVAFPPLGPLHSNFVNTLVHHHILDPQTHHKLWSTKPYISVAILMMTFCSFHLLLIPGSSSVTDVHAAAMRLG